MIGYYIAGGIGLAFVILVGVLLIRALTFKL